MSFLKNILSPFVEFKEEENINSSKRTASNQENQKNSSKTNNTETVVTEQPYVSSASSTSASAEFQKHFEDLIDDANAKNPLFQGTDFKEFMDSKVDVEAITDEATKYRTAFNVLKRTGLTKEKLITTGKEYLKLIDNDLNGFSAAFNQQYKTDIEQKEQLLKKKTEELQAYSEKIDQLNKDIKKMSQEIIQSKEHLNTNRNSFISAAENKKTEIEDELRKIDRYFS